MAIASLGMNIIELPFLNPLNARQLPWEVCTLNQRIKKIASAVLPLTVALVLANSLGGSIVAYLGVLTINALVSKVSNSIFLYKYENLNDSEIQRRKSITLTRDKVISMLNRGIKDFRYYNFTAADLRGANLTGADLTEADLTYANLSWADLNNANLSWADLNNANLSWANLRNAILRNTDLGNTDLTGASLMGAILMGASLSWANLSWANLRNAILRNTDLGNTDLCNANLTDADLRGAKLTLTTLCNANLSDVDLTAVYLIDVDLSKAIFANTHITREQYETIENTPFITEKSSEEIKGLFVIEERESA